MFIDEAKIIVRGGNGGRGCVSFRREKYVPRGGPDGGDGGKGGSVILHANHQKHTLMDITQRTTYSAENGRPGEGGNRSGRNGLDIIIDLPAGTIVRDESTEEVLCDLKADGQRFVVARGGKGGHGNKFYATSTNQAPREYQDGGEGEERRLYLELKLVADVGLVGLPNAGKSTLLSRLSRAHPKIADYPFTTLEPQLGVMRLGDYREIVIADLPGLIEGAHEGSGLGDEFLRHVDRTRILLHMVDVSSAAMSSPADAYRTIRRELEEYSKSLAAKREIVVASKTDSMDAAEGMDELRAVAGDRPFAAISAVTGEGLDALAKLILEELDKCS